MLAGAVPPVVQPSLAGIPTSSRPKSSGARSASRSNKAVGAEASRSQERLASLGSCGRIVDRHAPRDACVNVIGAASRASFWNSAYGP
jgi:hypothetical protein